MKKIANTLLISTLLIASTGGAFADSKNWSAAKKQQIEVNRNSDAGIGNGGERKYYGRWRATIYGEDGPMDRDPGGSEGVNQACSTGTAYYVSDC